MSNSFEKSVKGGTKVKLAPPKSKYVEHILLATQSGEAGVAEVFRTLTHRLRDSTWTVAFKSLIIVHLMIKEGARDVTLSYLAVSPAHRLAINSFTDVQTQGQNIRRYSEYLLARARAYEKARVDFVRNGDGHMRGLSVDKGLLRETEIVQDQIKVLLRCNLLDTDTENEISLTAYRLLTRDLLDLFTVVNEAVMNVLQHYFELSKPDAERAVKIYTQFCKQTELVVGYLKVAQQHQHAMRLEIPKIKHAPIDLATTLHEYLNDKDFEVHRRQYLAQQESKKTGKPLSKPAALPQSTQKAAPVSKPAENATFSSNNLFAATPTSPQKGPAPDLIDFFESIESNQQPLAQNPGQFQSQPTGFVQQQAFQQPVQTFAPQQQQQLPFTGFEGNGQAQFQQQPVPQQIHQQQPLQTNFTGAGFGGYTAQPQQSFQTGNPFGQGQPLVSSPIAQQQQQQPSELQRQATNPFRKSMLPTPTGASEGFGQQTPAFPIQPQNTNPFARNVETPPVPQLPHNFQQSPSSPFATQQQQQLPQQLQHNQPQPLQAQPTGTNPFARAQPAFQPQSQPAAQPLQMQPTGSTNPFRQSTFVNQSTGTGWQNVQQPTMGGLEQLQTVPVFPRPGQPQQNPQQQASPWG